MNLIVLEHHSIQSIEHDYQLKQPTMDGVILPLNQQYREPKRMSKDDLPVSKVTTIILLLEPLAPIPVSVYTYSSSNLDEAHFQRHSIAT